MYDLKDYRQRKGDASMLEETIEELERHISKLLKMPKEERLRRFKIAQGYLDCAKYDIEAAKILYESKINSLAVYHLQQAIEKECKSVAIALLYVHPDKVKKEIYHKSPLAFVRLVQSTPVVELVKSLGVVGIRTDIENLEKMIEDRKKREKVLRASKEEIDDLLEILENYKKTMSNEKLIADMEPWIKLIGEIFNIDIDAKTILELTNSFIDIYILSCITFPHWLSTRYPDQSLKPNEYRGGLGILDYFKKLLELGERSMESIEKYISIVMSENHQS